MKKVFLIGKLNSVIKNINKVLQKHFQIQLTSENPEVLRGMLEMEKPDIILFCLIDMQEGRENIFKELEKRSIMVPVVCLGSKEDIDLYRDYIDRGGYEVLLRPVTTTEITKKMYELLGIKDSDGTKVIRQKDDMEQRKTILLIDDSAVQLRMMKGLLTDKYDVEMAKSAEAAMSCIEKKVPDMIFLDYDMPEHDGREVLKLIRENEPSKNVPVVFLTGVKDRKRIEAVLDLKPEGYLLKPVSQNKIYQIIENIFDSDGEL